MPSSSKKSKSDEKKKRSSSDETKLKMKKEKSKGDSKRELKPKKVIDKKKKSSKTSSKKSSSEPKDEKKTSPSSGAAAKVKITSGTISRASKNRLENFMRLVYRRAKEIMPGMEISNRGAFTLATMLDQTSERIVDRTLEVFSTQGRKTVNVSDACVALATCLPQYLYLPGILRGARAIAKRHGNSDKLQKVFDAQQAEDFPTHY
jgi:histone H3/H4